MKNKQIRFVLVIFLFIFSFTSVYAQETESKKKSCLWKIQSKTNSVYLVGSIHYLKKENYPLPESFDKVFEDVGSLVFEMNLDSATTPKSQRFIMQKASFKNEQTLQTTLNEETFTLASKKSSEIGLPIATLNGFKPWFFSLSLIALKLQSLGYNPNFGIDKHFFEKAKEAKKQILAFETLEYQINLFDELADSLQEMMVLQTLEEFDVIETELEKLVEAWKKGDVNGLEATVLKSLKEYPDILERFITQRNENWLPRILEILQSHDNYMIIVGAGHLVGEKGLINLLQDRRFKIVQL